MDLSNIGLGLLILPTDYEASVLPWRVGRSRLILASYRKAQSAAALTDDEGCGGQYTLSPVRCPRVACGRVATPGRVAGQLHLSMCLGTRRSSSGSQAAPSPVPLQGQLQRKLLALRCNEIFLLVLEVLFRGYRGGPLVVQDLVPSGRAR